MNMNKVRTRVYLGIFSIILLMLSAMYIDARPPLPTPTPTPGPGNIRLREAMDFNGDGFADFVLFRPDGTWNIKTLASTTTPTFGDPYNDIVAPGDFDGDGKADLSVFRRYTGEWIRRNSSNNLDVVTNWGINGDEPVARDYDGDGITDMAVARRTGQYLIWYVLKSSDSSNYSIQFGLSGDFPAPGDYDGDGMFDLAVQRIGALPSSPATFYSLKTTTGLMETVVLGAGDDRAVPGDYDGDGKTDYAVVREWDITNQNLVWTIRKSTDPSNLLYVSYGLTCREEILGPLVRACDANLTQNDYDGDGATDISVFRTRLDSTSSFFYLTSSSGFHPTSSTEVPFGVKYDYPAASHDSH